MALICQGRVRRSDRWSLVLDGGSFLLLPTKGHVAEFLVCSGRGYHPQKSQSVRQQQPCDGRFRLINARDGLIAIVYGQLY